MKRLMMSTAMAMTLGMSGMALAQTAEVPVDPMASGAPEPSATTMDATTMEAPMVPATVGEMQVPGFLASDFAGMSLYAFNPETMAAAEQSDASHWNSGEAITAVRDDWEDIGAINDTILSQDGKVRGVLVDVGGFLGIGAKTVLIDIGDLYFVPNDDTPEVLSDFHAVAGLTRAQLEALPEFSEAILVAGYPWGGEPAGDPMPGMDPAPADLDTLEAPVGQGAPLQRGVMLNETDDGMEHEGADLTDPAPAVAPTPSDQGQAVVDVQTADEPGAMPTAQELMGAAVVDGAGNSVGSVEDVVLDGAVVSGIIVDVGGFLGIGGHRVSIPFDGVTVVRNTDTGNVDHIQVALTREQLKALPEHE